MISEIKMISTLLYGGLGLCGTLATIQALTDKSKLATSKFGNKKHYKAITGTNGFVLSKNFQLSKEKSFEGTLILAPTGEHKTTSIIAPNLLSNNLPKSSLVIADPKGELYKLTSKYQKSIGRKPILFTPLDASNAKYNLLDQCKDSSEVKQLAQTILINGDLSYKIAVGSSSSSSAEWLNMAQPLFNAVLLHEKQHKGSVYKAIRLILDSDYMDFCEVMENSTEQVQIQFKIFNSSAESPKTYASIRTTLLTSLQIFVDEYLIETLKSTDFTAKDLRNKSIALYISYPERKSLYLAPFLACFYSQFINNLMDIENGLPIYFLLDEFANIGNINNIAGTLSTCRSREIGFICCIQSLTQLFQNYGRFNAQNILNNLKTKIILPSLTDMEALRYISELCGYTEILKDGHMTKKLLFEKDEVRRLKDDEVLIISHNKLPYIDKKNIYYIQKKYIKNVI